MVTPAVKREAVAHLKMEHEMSERRACRVIGCQRMTVRYRSRRPDDPTLRDRLRALARERRRFGYRRLLIFLRREGFIVNHKRLFRIYREERLMVRKRGGRKRALGTRAPMAVPRLPNDRWSLDFVSDQFASGRRIPYPGDLRRLHPGMPRGRGRCLVVRPPGGARTRSSDRHAWQAGDDCQRQRHRADQQRDPVLGGSNPRGMALHRAGKAHAERLRRELQRAPAGRVLERDAVHFPATGTPRARRLATRLQ